jgi:hypothetical protein
MRKIIAIVFMFPAALLFMLAEMIWDDAFIWYLEGYNRALDKYIEKYGRKS